jgi:hypothetical protein
MPVESIDSFRSISQINLEHRAVNYDVANEIMKLVGSFGVVQVLFSPLAPGLRMISPEVNCSKFKPSEGLTRSALFRNPLVPCAFSSQ